MSDSRLEKFIYAICSMDVSDLPVPLSRIEKLWNCLITGETPDFEPLSRNEKYLMAMLDRYDISNLPAPMSRGEKLLYKIAVGETDLSDVPGYLSRYEELLKYLIENGGISGGDFEYVLYTLNQSLYTLYTTAEKPVKSAILKGLTLVNLSENLNTITRRLDFWYTDEMLMDNIEKLKRNTYYTVLYRIENLNGNHENYNDNEVGIGEIGYEKNLPATDIQTELDKNGGWCKIKFQLTDSFMSEYSTYKHLYIRPIRRSTAPVESETIDYTIRGFAILEGDYMTNPIPFNEVFEGMQSVKMPVLTTVGKNLFDGKYHAYKYVDTENGILRDSSDSHATDFILIRGFESISCSNEGYEAFAFYNENKIFIMGGFGKQLEVPKNAYYVRFTIKPTDNLAKFMVVEGSLLPPYEPYKSNILSTPEDLELCGIGDVKDTLDISTGEKVECIGEIVLDGSEDENWIYDGQYDVFVFEGLIYANNYLSTHILDKITWNGADRFALTPSNYGITSNSEGIEYLSNHPITLQYELATPIVKTVDLTTVDQDNQPTQLGTFENITHVSLEAENLIPEVEMEVATNLLEDTVFNLTNTFNTLYPTAAKPVVDGTLYGQTLVNCLKPQSGNYNDYQISSTYKDLTLFKPNTLYTFINNWDKGGILAISNNNGQITNVNFTKNSSILFTTPNAITNVEIYSVNMTHGGTQADCEKWKSSFMIIEGDHTNVDIPYFEGMQSVKMPVLTITGKNLWDKKNFVNGIIDGESIRVSAGDLYDTRFYYDFKENQQYVFTLTSYSENKKLVYFKYNYTDGTDSGYTNFLSCNGEKKHFISSANKTILYISFVHSDNDNYTLSNVQLEEGSVATPYEPYKTITLSTPSDLELRKVGEVQDEVNVMTGEVLERIGEFILNGSEYWDIVNDTFRTMVINDKVIKLETQADRDKIVISCDRYPSRTYNDPWSGVSSSFISLTVDKVIVINDKNFTTVEEWKEYLSQNPLTIKFVLATPVTKTVDLSIVNQDGNETKLRTFDDTTHVLLESEGLVPMASLTVRTKIPSASSTSLLMDDISTEQQQLESTVDEQSNNVDAIMMATTEIYEETL